MKRGKFMTGEQTLALGMSAYLCLMNDLSFTGFVHSAKETKPRVWNLVPDEDATNNNRAYDVFTLIQSKYEYGGIHHGYLHRTKAYRVSIPKDRLNEWYSTETRDTGIIRFIYFEELISDCGWNHSKKWDNQSVNYAQIPK